MFKPTPEQEDFLAAEGHIVVCACPGSGKTRVVAKKLVNYIANWNKLHSGVAVLSFTNVASEEINRQVKELSSYRAQINYPHFVGTLDAFLNQFVFLRFGYLLQTEMRRRPKIVHENYGELNFYSRIYECNKHCVGNPFIFHWSLQGLLKDNKPIDCVVSPKDRPCIKFKTQMVKRGIVTQREVASLSLRILKRFPHIANAIARRFPIIIVDEAQDTSGEQMEILDILAAAGVQTMVLMGDPDQAIYEWRDATPEYFIAKLNDASWQTKYLTATFRSSQHICNAAFYFSSMLQGKRPANAQGETADHSQKPVLLKMRKATTREEAIERFKQYCLQLGIEYSYTNIAILTRGKIHKGIKIEGLWKSREVESLANASYAWYCGSKKQAYKICEKVLFSLAIGEISSFSEEEITEKIEVSMAHAQWKHRVIMLLQNLPSPNLLLEAWHQALLINISGLIDKGIISLREGIHISQKIKIKSRDKGNPEFLHRPLTEYFEKRAVDEVTLSSVHGVKGESFDAVLLLVESTKGGTTLTPSILNTSILSNELIRIAYVAMTRPRILLMVAVPETKTVLSRFPKECWEYVVL